MGTLAEIPYFQFFIFVTISAAVFGVGLYAYHRWKLESTGRGLLVIATLLVPLDFVAMAGLSRDSWTPTALVTELVSLGIFVWLVGLAGRVLVPRGWWLAVLAVVGNSAAVLGIARLVHPDSPLWPLLGAGALPVGLFGLAVGGQIVGLARHGRAVKSRAASRGAWHAAARAVAANGLFTLLGVAAFSMVVALGLWVALAVRSRELAAVLGPLSLLVALAAMPVVAAGLTAMRGAARDKTLGGFHLAGTWVALLGMLAMLAGLGLAWPRPAWIIAVGTLEATALAAAAFRWRLPLLHAGAIAAAALVYLTAFHLALGELAWADGDFAKLNADMLRITVSARSGTALGGLFLALAAVSELLARLGYRRHGVIYMGGCVVAAVAGLALVTCHGLLSGGVDARQAAILYGIYGGGSLALVARWRRVELSWLGTLLLAAAPLWAMRLVSGNLRVESALGCRAGRRGAGDGRGRCALAPSLWWRVGRSVAENLGTRQRY